LKNRGSAQIFTPKGQIDFFKQRLHTHGAGLIDHQAQSTPLAVLTHIDNAFGEGIIRQTRHRDQKMMRQVDGAIIRVGCVHKIILAKVSFDKITCTPISQRFDVVQARLAPDRQSALGPSFGSMPRGAGYFYLRR
jgi:hypothetical protein